MEEQADLELKQLGGFTGTTRYYAVLGVRVTDGVNYIMENGYAWLVTDAIAAIRATPKLRAETFLVVKLKRDPDGGKATMTIDDGNNNVQHTQRYEWTDAKKDVKLYWENGVLILPTEH